MSFENDLELSKSYSILELVRECQDSLGYDYGRVRPEVEMDQKTRCPVHHDGSPSSKVYVKSNSVYCWVCGKTWDPPALYAAHFGVPLGRAMRVLLERLGVASVVVSEEDLVEEAKKLVPDDPTPHLLWLDSISAWAIENSATADHLDELVDVCDVARGLDSEASVALVRRGLVWAQMVCEARQIRIPPPPSAESPDVLYLMGM